MLLIPFIVFVTCLLLTYALFLFTSRGSDKKRAPLNERLAEAIRSSAHSGDAEVQLAREELLSEIPWLNRSLVKLELVSKLKRMIDQADVNITVMRLLLFSAMAGVLAFLAVSMVSQSYLLMSVFGFIAGSLPILHVIGKRKKRMKRFLQLLPDALDLMSRGLSAGHAFTEALHMVAAEMPEPIATEFRKTYEEQNLGLSLKLALENLVHRMPLLDLRMCITAILIQRETGGNLSEILDNLAHVVRERFKILRQARVHTAHGRFTGYVLLGLPAFLAVALSYINPDLMGLLFRERIGQMMLITAMVLQAVGYVWIRKVIKIEV